MRQPRIVKISALTRISWKAARSCEWLSLGKNIVAREDSISAAPRRSYPPRGAAITTPDSLIRTALIAIDRRGAMRLPTSVQSVLRFIVGGTKASSVRHDERADKCRRRRRRRADAKIVIFDFRPYFFDAGDKPARYRRVRGKSDETPTTSVGRSTCVWRDRSGYAIVGYWTLFLRRPSSRLRAAVVIWKSIQVCKDRALKRRILSRGWTYELQNRSENRAHHSPALLLSWTAKDGERDKFKVGMDARRSTLSVLI